MKPQHSHKTEPNFDRVARVYRWAEYLSLGPLLQRTRIHFLPQLTECRSAFVLGDGDGRFLARLLAQNPSLHALAVDTSATMLELLNERCATASDRLRLQQTSALTAIPPDDVDLIVTHFFLDCLTQAEVDELAERIAAQSQPETLWLLSDFQIPPSRAVRPLARLYIRALYFAFRLLTGLRVQHLPDTQATLSHAGFKRIAQHERLCGIIYTELWQKKETNNNPGAPSSRRLLPMSVSPETYAPELDTRIPTTPKFRFSTIENNKRRNPFAPLIIHIYRCGNDKPAHIRET